MHEGKYDIADRDVRRDLPPRDEPYWYTFSPRQSIGFCKMQAWTWYGGVSFGDRTWRRKQLGIVAESPEDRHGHERLTFDQAMGVVRKWCAEAIAVGPNWERGRDTNLFPPPDSKDYTVRHAFWDWLEWRKSAGLLLHNYKVTYRRYLDHPLADLPLSQLEQRDIIKWHDDIAATPARNSTKKYPPLSDAEVGSELYEAIRRRRRTANTHLMALKNALDHAHLHGLVDDTIGWRGVKIHPHTANHRPLILDPDEVQELISKLEGPVRLLVEAVWHTGARIGELASLTSERALADFRKIIVLDSKKRHLRGVAVTEEGAAFFKRVADGVPHGHPVFLDTTGKPWTANFAGHKLRKELARIECPSPVTYRSIRSSYSGYLIGQGVPPAVVARQLGHYSSITTELYYGHISEFAIDAMIREKIDGAALPKPS